MMVRCLHCDRSPEACSLHYENPRTPTEMDSVKEAARRTAINLMRLNEALEMKDAETYSTSRPPSSDYSRREHRKINLEYEYRKWFQSVAGSSQMGSLDKGTNGSSGGPAATSEST